MEAPKAAPILLESDTKLVEDAPLSLATGPNVKLLDLDEEHKAKANVVARDIVVSLVGCTLYGRVIEGNASVCISSIEPGAESVLLYEGNNDVDPPMVRLDDALKFIPSSLWRLCRLSQRNLNKPVRI